MAQVGTILSKSSRIGFDSRQTEKEDVKTERPESSNREALRKTRKCSQKDIDSLKRNPNDSNGVIVTKAGEFCGVLAERDGGFVVRKFKKSNNITDYACNSNFLSICVVSDLSCSSKFVHSNEISKKCVCLPTEVSDVYCCIPIVHSNE